MKNLTHGFTLVESIIALSIASVVIGGVGLALNTAVQGQIQQNIALSERASMSRLLETLQHQTLPLVGYDDSGATSMALLYADTTVAVDGGPFTIENGWATVDGARISVPQQACTKAQFDGKALRLGFEGGTISISGRPSNYDIAALRVIPEPDQSRIRVALKGARSGETMSGVLHIKPIGQAACPVVQTYQPSEAGAPGEPVVPVPGGSVMSTVRPPSLVPPVAPVPPTPPSGEPTPGGGKCSSGWGSSSGGRVSIKQCPGGEGDLNERAQSRADSLEPVCVQDYKGSRTSSSYSNGVKTTVTISPEQKMC
ncbi:PulJ/GspJ family protein [Deinococcus sedimenti]|nr:prepilin-type N-terminal cleavage/methylation domain-containing protein [Deinococcus sedimenti]